MAKLMKFSVLITTVLLLLAVPVLAIILSNPPATCSGQWTSCTNAFVDDANRATATPSTTANKTGIWNNYGINIPSSASIDSVLIRADFFASKANGYINIRASNNGGAALGPSHVVGGNTAEQTFWVDVTNDFAWTPAMLANNNFRVNVTCFRLSGSKNPTCNLDWVPVDVTYTPFDYSVSISPASGNVTPGNSTDTTLTAILLGGVSQPVNLSYSGCPAFATCSFNTTNGSPTYNSLFTAATTNNITVGNYTITLTGTGDGKVRSLNYTLNVV